MKEQLKRVEDFHTSFDLPVRQKPEVHDALQESVLRYKLMREENEEYLDAAERGDLIEVADALGDMLYILCGTILSHGLQEKIVEVFNEIHRSNMSKLDANGQPIYRSDGKVLKGPNYRPPNIAEVLTDAWE